MASLFPLISAPGSAGASGTNTLPLCRETDWDFQTNQPIWRGGNPVFVTGARAVLIWAWNTLHTERFAHDVYSGAYGPAESVRLHKDELCPRADDAAQVLAHHLQ